MRARTATARLAAALALALAACASGSAQGKWEVLFDGRSTDAWRGYKQQAFPAEGWRVEDGALRAVAGGGGDIVTKDVYGDFELELEWRVSPGANSGVFYRATEEGEAVYHTGPEMQILDDDKHQDGKSPLTSAGSLYALIAPAGKALEPVGEWNTARVVVRRGRAEHWLNGGKVVEYEWGSDALAKLIAGSKFSAWPGFAKAPEGRIGLQNHGDDVWFRKIRIRRL
jgi:hypothetical protein